MFAASAGTAYTTGRQTTFLPQLPLALCNGVTMQSGDARQLLDAAATDFRGEQTRKKSAQPFVRHSKKAVDGPMFAHNRTTPFLLAHRTFTGVNRSNMRSNHVNLPP
jgi:hypothetical protein